MAKLEPFFDRMGAYESKKILLIASGLTNRSETIYELMFLFVRVFQKCYF